MNFLASAKKSEIKYIFILFISTRVALTLIGLFSRLTLERQYGKQYIWSKYLWLDIWGVWDTFWYMDIATNGYSLPGSNPLDQDQANYAFFPLYPLLMKVLGEIFVGQHYLAGVILSNVSLIVACIFLYKLLRLDLNSQKISFNTIKYLFLSPTAFIFSGVFTESLYLALIILCFYFAKKKNWLLVGIAGCFLSLTRALGVFIIFPMLYEYFKEVNFDFKKTKADLFFLLLIPLGLILFAIYNYHLTGDFLAFTHIQSTWNRNLVNPLKVLRNGLYQGLFKSDMRDLLESSFAIVSLILLLISSKKINFSYWIFWLYSILIPLLTGLESLPRYILPIFPLYILLAQFSRSRYFDQAATLFLGLLQGCLMVFWSCGFNLIV